MRDGDRAAPRTTAPIDRRLSGHGVLAEFGQATGDALGQAGPDALRQAGPDALGEDGPAGRRCVVGGAADLAREGRSQPVRQVARQRGQELVGLVQVRAVAGILDDDLAVTAAAAAYPSSTARVCATMGWGGQACSPGQPGTAPIEPR